LVSLAANLRKKNTQQSLSIPFLQYFNKKNGFLCTFYYLKLSIFNTNFIIFDDTIFDRQKKKGLEADFGNSSM